MKKNKRWNHIRSGLTVCIVSLVFVLSGCTNGFPKMPETRENQDYPKAQAMIVVATERNRYEKTYTDQIWDVTLENGQTFETYLLDQVKNFLKDLKTMNLLARDQEISLTSAEKDQIHQLSESYFNSLTSGDLAYMGITEEDVETMYQQYYIANKAVGQLTEEIDLEVSDSDAKVIEVLQIQVSDQEAAQKIYERVTDGNEDFRTVAKEVSEDTEIDRKIGRGEYAAALETAAFELENGQISLVTEYNGNYYIFQCVNDYDVEATQERKTRLYETRKNQAFRQIYSSFQQENKVNFSDEMWSDIHFDANDQTETDNFFTLYQEKFGSQGF